MLVNQPLAILSLFTSFSIMLQLNVLAKPLHGGARHQRSPVSCTDKSASCESGIRRVMTKHNWDMDTFVQRYCMGKHWWKEYCRKSCGFCTNLRELADTTTDTPDVSETVKSKTSGSFKKDVILPDNNEDVDTLVMNTSTSGHLESEISSHEDQDNGSGTTTEINGENMIYIEQSADTDNQTIIAKDVRQARVKVDVNHSFIQVDTGLALNVSSRDFDYFIPGDDKLTTGREPSTGKDDISTDNSLITDGGFAADVKPSGDNKNRQESDHRPADDQPGEHKHHRIEPTHGRQSVDEKLASGEGRESVKDKNRANGGDVRFGMKKSESSDSGSSRLIVDSHVMLSVSLICLCLLF